MKNETQHSLFNLVSTLRIVKEEIPVNVKQERSPYLKAVLSGTSRNDYSHSVKESQNPDRDAALRYIRDSKMIQKK
ncbi:MAG TPA: hypothetical protein PLU37_10805 [Chitinophagaceae bacterium]|nr:hypothetical protein [Chitinophagaceae bacterium]MCB9054566.1 hypothetical protein [Chitinophagales bacterium]HPG12012.1 hypothetical protein [Chitinophagaceae bacterium]HRX92513.1 hypothetical protein [Chitinophagaceae bacterium]